MARHADAVIARLLPEERGLARHLLGLLVTPQGTRSRRMATELLAGLQDQTAAAQATLDALVQGRLLVSQAAGDTGASTYEIAHEALLEGWDTLRGWLAGDAERRALQQRLTQAAAEWQRLGRTREALWSERQLAEIASLEPSTLGLQEEEFLLAARRALSWQRYRRLSMWLGAPLLLLFGYGGQASVHQYRQWTEIQKHLQAARMTRMQATALRSKAEAMRLRAFRAYDPPAPRLEEGETLWQTARDLLAEADGVYLQAARSVDAALALAPRRSESRALLGDILVERIRVTELAHRGTVRSELLARLADYDDDGTRKQHLQAPATLVVTAAPPGTRVALWRYDTDGRQLTRVADLGLVPVAPRSLVPGSYVLRFAAPDRADVSLPLWAEPGSMLPIDVVLPKQAAPRPGFVYVPEGRFLFGSSDDDDVRRGFHKTAPMHALTTNAYWIGRTEVTFGEWLKFLRALPPADRARLTPHTQVRGNTVDLRLLSGGHARLTLQLPTKTVSVLDGERWVYSERNRRATQDWLHFPVVGVSFKDAQAYARWLDQTRQVPGARLCSELEWERAARGADGRRFPSGNRLERDDADIDITYDRQPATFGPDEVGSHPGSRSPVGAEDMAGNVWEWTRSYAKEGEPVIRGGSWYQGELTARAMNREVAEDNTRTVLIGLRLCATPAE